MELAPEEHATIAEALAVEAERALTDRPPTAVGRCHGDEGLAERLQTLRKRLAAILQKALELWSSPLLELRERAQKAAGAIRQAAEHAHEAARRAAGVPGEVAQGFKALGEAASAAARSAAATVRSAAAVAQGVAEATGDVARWLPWAALGLAAWFVFKKRR